MCYKTQACLLTRQEPHEVVHNLFFVSDDVKHRVSGEIQSTLTGLHTTLPTQMNMTEPSAAPILLFQEKTHWHRPNFATNLRNSLHGVLIYQGTWT